MGLLYYVVSGPGETSELSCTNSCSIVGLSFGFLDQHWQRSSHILSSNPRLTTCSSLGRLGSSPCPFLKTTCIFFDIRIRHRVCKQLYNIQHDIIKRKKNRANLKNHHAKTVYITLGRHCGLFLEYLWCTPPTTIRLVRRLGDQITLELQE
jgi:hypothetical protein